MEQPIVKSEEVIEKNNMLIEITNATTQIKEQEKAFSHLHGILSKQNKMLAISKY